MSHNTNLFRSRNSLKMHWSHSGIDTFPVLQVMEQCRNTQTSLFRVSSATSAQYRGTVLLLTQKAKTIYCKVQQNVEAVQKDVNSNIGISGFGRKDNS